MSSDPLDAPLDAPTDPLEAPTNLIEATADPLDDSTMTHRKPPPTHNMILIQPLEVSY